MIRGIETPVKNVRRKVYEEVARVARRAKDLDNVEFNKEVEEIPYKIIKVNEPELRYSIYHERAIIRDRIRLAMGLSPNPDGEPTALTARMDKSNIDEIYYEPPLMSVMTSACQGCEDNTYEVSNKCRGCIAHPCTHVCPVGACEIIDGRSHIDKDKCIKCGKCKEACPYGAIVHNIRPCSDACGIKAISTDERGLAHIDSTKCVSCGMCEVSCPFGAISDKSQIFQLVRALSEGEEVVAEIAPAYVGQFGDNIKTRHLIAALNMVGFSKVYEVALGADIGAVSEAKHYVEKVKTGEVPFLLTSCCPAWSMLAKVHFPELAPSVSSALTPMVATARSIKKEHPNAKVVFIGPCASKKLEAQRTTVRSDVDFVVTFEEMRAIFDAFDIDMESFEAESSLHDATGAGRGYACAGGVASAVEECIKEYYPGTEVDIRHAEGLAECKKMLLLAKSGKLDGCMIEGMGCPGGCIAGAGTILDPEKAKKNVAKHIEHSTHKLPPKELGEIELK